MLLSVLWVKEEDSKKGLDIEGTLLKLRDALVEETDQVTFNKALAFATEQEYDEDVNLVSEVLWAVKLANGEGIQPTYDLIINGYRKALEDLKSSLDSREVTTIGGKDLVGYATGGMSWGEDTDAASLWNRLLFDDDPEYGVNPYTNLLFYSLFVIPHFLAKEDFQAMQKKIADQEARIQELTASKA